MTRSIQTIALTTAFDVAATFVERRWVLHILRALRTGPRRFSDLRAEIPRISSNVLTGRLDDLRQAGVVDRRQLPPPASVWVYDLTDLGKAADLTLESLEQWGKLLQAETIGDNSDDSG